MEVSIDVSELRKRKLAIATPMYGGMCSGQYTKSTADLARLGAEYKLDIQFYYLFNESLVQRARNYLVDEFLRTDCTHLLFIDADIGFDPSDVIALLAIAEPGSDKDIVCGPYPKKCISWEKVKRAVDKGFGDRDPENLANYIGDYVFNPTADVTEISISEPVEVLESGTGFMMIQRNVFERFAAAYPHLSYKPDHVRTEHFDGSREIMAYFDCPIDPKTRRYLSEDYMFCQYTRNAGMKVWLCPWMKLAHMGTYIYSGSLADLAVLGVSATADVHMLGKTKKLEGKIDIDNTTMVK
jgi:hypothetical protein